MSRTIRYESARRIASTNVLSTPLLIPLLCVCLSIGPSAGQTAQPHIVVMIADDLGWNDISFHGADEIPTPNIDALAYNGVILNRHYVLPTCTPSRTAFLTGRYPIRDGMQGYPLRGAEPRAIPLNVTLLPEYLRDLGYATHLVGKWHVGYYTDDHGPASRGFDTFLGYYSGYIQYFNHTLYESMQLGYDLHRIAGNNRTVEYRYDYMTDLITGEAESIISSHDPATPMYLQLAHLAPHASGDSRDVMQVRDENETNAEFGYIKDENRRKFASVVATLDESVGRVVEALSKANMLQNSIIIFMADNGAQTNGFLKNFGSNFPLRGLKSSLYEGAVRGAACVYSPLINSTSRVSTQLFHITDWLPTLYTAAGGDLNDLQDIDGIDQWSAIKSNADSQRDSLLVNIDEVTFSESALMGNYKLVHDTSLYQRYYGDDGNNPSYPEYNVTRVLQSPTAQAIANISGQTLGAENITNLRDEATVVCDSGKDLFNCGFHHCLFDVYEDPCETNDVFWKYPSVVRKLKKFIKDYRSVLMRQTNRPVDPSGFPSHFNDTWMPWRPNGYEPGVLF